MTTLRTFPESLYGATPAELESRVAIRQTNCVSGDEAQPALLHFRVAIDGVDRGYVTIARHERTKTLAWAGFALPEHAPANLVDLVHAQAFCAAKKTIPDMHWRVAYDCSPSDLSDAIGRSGNFVRRADDALSTVPAPDYYIRTVQAANAAGFSPRTWNTE